MRRARRGDHVARVLLVPGRIGDDEFAQRRGEVAIRDVDRNPLLALCRESVGEQGQVECLTAPARCVLDRGELVGEDGLRVVQQTPDQRALAVVHAARGQEPQDTVVEHVDFVHRRHQK